MWLFHNAQLTLVSCELVNEPHCQILYLTILWFLTDSNLNPTHPAQRPNIKGDMGIILVKGLEQMQR